MDLPVQMIAQHIVASGAIQQLNFVNNVKLLVVNVLDQLTLVLLAPLDFSKMALLVSLNVNLENI